ncbi:MAG: succinylglutamate desuccinylase/aspartoacylase family protein [Hyphomicrobiaceae bacterium]
MRASFEIAETKVKPGTQQLIDLPVAKLPNHTPVTLPVQVLHGRRDGPTLFVSAGIHGDEIVGVEVIRRLLNTRGLSALKGTLLCVPMVNIFGFLSQSRYLPDGRDLNRVFPGNKNGSLAGQLAHLLMSEIVSRSDFGIDLHTGANNRTNLPQLRGDFEKSNLRELAEVFGAPVVLQSTLREGSLRKAARDLKVEVLLYEAGEALRLDELCVRIGVKGILHVMQHTGMLKATGAHKPKQSPVFARSSSWVRASEGGIFRAQKALGDSVKKGDTLGVVNDPYENNEFPVVSDFAGVIIGRTNIAVVNRADALFHIARIAKPATAENRIEEISDEIGGDPIFDEDDIV